jgi:hypothetical protein
MKTLCSLFIAAFFIVVLGSGSVLIQGKQTQPPKTKPPVVKNLPTAAPPKPQKETPVTKREGSAEAKPGPTLVLSLNLTRDTTLPEGPSLLIEGAIGAYDGREGHLDIRLEKPGGTWGELIRIEIQNSQGKAIPGLTIKPLVRTEASILLDEERSGWVAWEVDFKAGAKLAPGTYSVVAFIDTEQADGSGWKGKAKSAPSELTVVAASAGLSEEGAAILALSESRLLAYESKDGEALAVCDAYLAKKPKDGMMLEEKGDLLMKAKKPAEALAAYNEALKNVAPLPANAVPEPPFELIRKQQLAEEALKRG